MSKQADEICLSSRLLEEDEYALLQGCDGSTPVKWTRWVACTSTESVILLPRFPLLPVLVEPSEPFHVLPGAQARIYVRIPLSLAVRVPPGDEVLEEYATARLSETWFGEPEAGELCFWLDSAVSRELDPVEEKDVSGVHAPVLIRNESAELLQVSRLCLRVDGLSIYRGKEWLWANETVVKYQGGPSPSRIEVRHGPPTEAPTAALLSGPRKSGEGTVVARTFRSLRRWTADLLDFD